MGFLFSKKRKDGNLVKGEDPMIRIMPYIMRGRNESAVYHTSTIDIEPIQAYIRSKRQEGERVTLFNVIVTAILQVLYNRPKLNRFIAGRRLYDHKEVDILYTVKIDMTDDAHESVAKVVFDGDDNMASVGQKMEEQIQLIKKENKKWDDVLIQYFSKMPRWFLRFFLGFLRWLDFHGMLPSFLIETIPMYSSVFISHLGSIGGDAVHHHLYEFGTTSIFMTIGKVYEKPCRAPDNSIDWRRVVDLKLTIDERIVDGFYLMKSLKLFNQLLENPDLLEYSPNTLRRLREEGKLTFGVNKVSRQMDEAEISELEALAVKKAEEIKAKRQEVEDSEDLNDITYSSWSKLKNIYKSRQKGREE